MDTTVTYEHDGQKCLVVMPDGAGKGKISFDPPFNVHNLNDEVDPTGLLSMILMVALAGADIHAVNGEVVTDGPGT